VRLVAEHRDLEHVRAASLEDLLNRAGTRHPVPDHDQPALPTHDSPL